MGLLELFIANVFDIYPNDQFVKQFIDGQSLDLAKMLSHPFLKLTIVYSHVWYEIYKTYPTKRDFVNFVNTTKTLPEGFNPASFAEKSFVEKVLNTFVHAKMGLMKHLDPLQIFNSVQDLVADLDSHKSVVDRLVKKWQYRFCSKQAPSTQNLLACFASIANAYKPPNIYEYKVNPLTGSFNETVMFAKVDDVYLNESEKIQYTLYKDNHFMAKLIDNVGILFDSSVDEMPSHVTSPLLSTLSKERYLAVINPPTNVSWDPAYTFYVVPEMLYMLPSVFSNFVCVSNRDNPQQRGLSANRDLSIYYLWARRPVPSPDLPEITKTYDRYIINNLDHSTGKARINKYFVLDPAPPNSPPTAGLVLCGPRTYELYKDDIHSRGYTVTCDRECNPEYVVDLYQELDLPSYMANGSVPVCGTEYNMCIVPFVTGFTCQGRPSEALGADPVVTSNIKENIKVFSFLKDTSVYEYYVRKHLDLSCPCRTINARNGLLLYLNFVCLYFMRNLSKIAGLEDKASRDQQYKAIILDNRPNPLSVFSVLFTLSNLNVSWSCKVYSSKAGMSYYEKFLGRVAEVAHLPALDVPRFHIDVYNNILKSAEFWRSVGSVKTLVIQDDGVLLRPGIERFMEYDFIGASWVDNVANQYIKENISEDLVGNGGFSLRTNSQMLHVCEAFKKEKNWLFYKNITQIPEDVYFVYGLKRTEGARMPSFQAGTEFASEEVCHMGSIGVHKLWCYHIADVTQKFFNSLLV